MKGEGKTLNKTEGLVNSSRITNVYIKNVIISSKADWVTDTLRRNNGSLTRNYTVEGKIFLFVQAKESRISVVLSSILWLGNSSKVNVPVFEAKPFRGTWKSPLLTFRAKAVVTDRQIKVVFYVLNESVNPEIKTLTVKGIADGQKRVILFEETNVVIVKKVEI